MYRSPFRVPFRRLGHQVAAAFFALALSSPVAAQVVINEIMQNPSAVADSAGEWFELFNPGGSAVDINGWTIEDNDFDSHVIANGGPLVIPAGGYVVLANNGISGTNGGVSVDYVYGSSFFLANGADELVLLDTFLTEIDRVEWDGGPTFPDPNGASMALRDPALDNNLGSNWCESTTPFGAGDRGTPGAANDCPATPVSLVINEIDYDQPGTDTAEFVEIRNNGAAAVDLSPFELRLVNGSGGGAAIYDTIVLPAVSLAAGDYFVVCANAATVANCDLDDGPDTNFIQNGAPDAVALARTSDGTILDAVSYEGDTGAPYTEGSGSGLEDASSFTDSGISRCLDGSDTDQNNVDLIFTGITPGAANDCGAAGADLVINEIDYDQPGTDFAEFIEIKNVTAFEIGLSGYAVELVNGTGGGASVYQTILLPDVPLAAGDYFVVCADAATVFRCDLDVSPDSNLIQNGSPDAVALTFAGAIVDTVSYEGDTGAPYTEGTGSGLEDPGSGGVGGGNDNKGISRFPDGADTDVNNVDLSTRCITPGAANTTASSDCPTPGPPALVINEIDYDQPGTDAAEFVEIKNVGAGAASLAGVELLLVNGSGGGAAIYDTIALPSVTLAAGDYFVVCANAATVAVCDLDDAPDTNFIQNGSPDAVALRFEGVILDAVSYEGDTGTPFTEGSGSGLEDSAAAGNDNKGISRFPDGVDTDVNNADLTFVCITPGGANTDRTTSCSPTGPVLEIYEIQGSGPASPFAGSAVTTHDNVVTALGVDGFFMQTPAVRTDGDVDTSDGIFVFTGAPPTVSVGDLVDVTGNVQEFFGFTEFGFGSTVTVVGSGLVPAPVAFDAAVPSPDPAFPSCSIEFECYEGMLISVADGTVTGPNQRFGTDPIAEVHVTAASSRTFREPGIEFPGLSGLPLWDGNPEVFELDPDKLGLDNEIIPAGSPFAATGVLGFEFGGYELWPTVLEFVPVPLPLPVRPREPGELTVGTLNLFRLFDDVDDPPDGGRNDAVVSTAEYERRLAKFSAYIREVLDSPDVLAVQEAESLTVLEDLAAEILADSAGAVDYSAYLIEGNDVGTIDVGFLVREKILVDAVTQLGKDEILSFDGSLLHDRPPLLLEGSVQLEFGTYPIAVMVVHNRSLGGIDDPFDGPRVRQKRYEQAVSIVDKIEALKLTDPDVRLVVTGDFNAYEFTDGYVDAVGVITGDFDPADNLVCDTNDCSLVPDTDLFDEVLGMAAAERYSFIFAGSAQVLDHALTSVGLAAEVSGAEYGRGNADAAVDLINDDGSVTPANLPLRSSDHDGLVVYITDDFDADGVPNDDDACPGTVIPETPPSMGLGPNHYVLLDGDGVFDTLTPPGGGPGDVFTLGDTAGCSCEQIIDALHLGAGHRKHGCSVGVMRNWVAAVAP